MARVGKMRVEYTNSQVDEGVLLERKKTKSKRKGEK